jgi:hypothetical protein
MMPPFTFTAPCWTREDELLERDGLDIAEQLAIHHDIFGRPHPLTWSGTNSRKNGTNDYNCCNSSEKTTNSVQHGVQCRGRLVQAVSDFITNVITDQDKSAYLEALTVAPTIVYDESSIELFLYSASQRCVHHCQGMDHEKWIVQDAANRLVAYWKLRYQFFHGAPNAFLPMTILPNGAMYPYLSQLERGFVFPMPPDRAGRTVIYYDRIRSGQCEALVDVISCCTFYVYHVVAHEQYSNFLLRHGQGISTALLDGEIQVQPDGLVLLVNVTRYVSNTPIIVACFYCYFCHADVVFTLVIGCDRVTTCTNIIIAR